MVKLLKLLGYVVFFLGAVLFFMPKVSLYHYAEKELEKYKVIFSNEELVDTGFTLELHQTDISYEAIQSASVENIDINIFLLYNSVSVTNIQLSEMAATFVPLKIERLEIQYSILHPFYVKAQAKGKFGEASADLHIFDRNVSVVLNPSQVMKKKYLKTLGQLKKNEQGSYEYAKTF